MEYADNEGRDWRAQVQDWLEHELASTVFNPNEESQKFFDAHFPGINFRALKHTDPTRFQEIVRRLVDLDCREIADRSDYLICYWDSGAMRGAGTKGELTMAHYFGKAVYLVTSMPFTDIPGWVLGCTNKMFPDFDQLRQFLFSSTR
jgi:hypothetical protein